MDTPVVAQEQTTPAAAIPQHIYEFIFTDSYSDDVFNQYSNASDALKLQVQNTANNLQNILKIKPGIRSISSFANYDNNQYKVTVINSLWVDTTLPTA